jgi:hypothetical protein
MRCAQKFNEAPHSEEVCLTGTSAATHGQVFMAADRFKHLFCPWMPDEIFARTRMIPQKINRLAKMMGCARRLRRSFAIAEQLNV